MIVRDEDEAANNPAGRVLWFLRQLQQYSHTGIYRDRYLADTLRELVGAEPGSAASYRVATEVREQIELVPELMQPYEGTPGYGPIFKHYQEVLDAGERIQLPRSYNLAQILAPVSAAGWASVEFAHEVLSGPSVEKRLTSQRAVEYLQSIQGLIVEIVGDETMSQPDRDRLVQLLRRVENTLINIKIYGANHVEEAAVTVAGLVQVEKDLWDRIEGKKWFQRFGTVISGLLLALGAVGGLPAIESVVSDSPSEVVVVGDQTQPDRVVPSGSDGEGEVVDGELVEDEGR